jgi:HEAT repeat protein
MKRNWLTIILFFALPAAIVVVAIIRGNSLHQRIQAERWFRELRIVRTKEPSPPLEALRKMGPAALPTLQEALKASLPSTRLRAAWALGKLGPMASNAVPDLVQGLDDDKVDVRLGSMEALTWIGTARSDLVPKMLAKLDKWTECYHAADLLDEIEQQRKAMNLPPAYSDAYEYAMAFANGATPAVQLRAVPKLPLNDERSLAVFKAFLNHTNGWVRQQTAIFLNDHNIVLTNATGAVNVSPGR